MRHPAITYGLFPLTFGAAMAAGIYGAAAGWSHQVLLAAITAGAVLIIVVFERIQPQFSGWGRSHDDVPTDLAHSVVSMIMLPPLVEVGLRGGVLRASQLAAQANPIDIWPHHWPVLLQLAVALLLSQLGEYWVHRGMHETKLLWRLHATHHSPTRLYWLNAGRFHPLDTAISLTVSVTPMIALGVGEEVMLLVTVWIAVHGLFQHCNIHLVLGPLNYIFSMAELHRWHHSLILEEANSNYGNNIIFWDLVFGTLHYPRDREAAQAIGLSDMPRFPQRWLGQILSPFQWARISAPPGEDEPQ